MHIPPWTVLAGFGSLTRDELSDLLAVFEDTTLLNVVASRIKDVADHGRKGERIDADAAFQRRLEETSGEVFQSDRSDAVLRLQLWHRTREALELEAAIPLATRTANLRAAEVAQRAADELRDSVAKVEEKEQASTSFGGRVWSGIEGFFSSERADFSEVVGAQASRMLAEAAEHGLLDDATREALVERVQERLKDAPPELRDRSVEHAQKAGDATALTVLTTGSSLVGLGVAVELAGFGAYILAAKASAILPLIGGKAAVSGLAVLANPLFIVPMVIGGGVLASRQFSRSARAKLASGLTIQMALKGLAAGRSGLGTCLDDFRSLAGKDVEAAGAGSAQLHNRRTDLIGDLVGRPLPGSPGQPPQGLDKPPTGRTLDGLEPVLFPDQKGVASEAMVVGGVTMADIVYHAAAIDPEVVKAVAFSHQRSEDISGVFDFGAFADRVQSLTGAALTGTENQLRGYVAEQLVVTRLQEQGHQVDLAPASNTPGYDLKVDGEEFQVKCLNDVSGLSEHFKSYDYPVYVNAELAEKVRGIAPPPEWIDKVHFVEGYDREAAEEILQRGLEHGAALDDLNIPVFAVAVSAARNVHAWWKGALSLQDLPFEVAVDGAIKGSLTAAGGFVGQSLGLLLFGPAGAVIFGAAGGTGALFGSGLARQQLDRALMGEWLSDLGEPTEDFRVSLKEVMRRKIRILEGKAGRIDVGDGEVAEWIRLRLFDNALAIAEGIAELEFDAVERRQPDRAKELLRLMKDVGVHPWSVRSQLARLANSLGGKPTAREAVRDVFKRLRGRGGH